MNKVLIVGGSYFIGPYLIDYLENSHFEIHILNRGNKKLNKKFVYQHICDRRSDMISDVVSQIMPNVIIDLCAYEVGDIDRILKKYQPKQYIYVSTANTYDFSEKLELINDKPDYKNNIVYNYVLNKKKLEIELMKYKEIFCTILNPAILYGPLNYANREQFFLNSMIINNEVFLPSNSKSKFSMVYAADFAKIIGMCILNSDVYDNQFLVSGIDYVNWEIMHKVLKEIQKDCNFYLYTIDTIKKEKIAIPFPIENDEYYPDQKIFDILKFEKTPLKEGLINTYNSMKIR